jgi:hypothetical protein
MIEYNSDYYYNLLKIHSSTAKMICESRWKFIKDNISKNDNLVNALDYGCGIGFMKAFAPDWITEVDTYDIMPIIQTGIRANVYSIVMLYDVLEHIPDFTELLPVLNKTKYVVVTVPIKPPLLAWDKYKHFKPGEHLHYFSHDLLEHIFKVMGFRLVRKGKPECPPREHVWTFLFKRIEK